MGLGAAFTYFFYSWYSKFLQAGREVNNIEAGWLTSLVMAGAPAGVFLGGFLADRITRRAAEPVRARRYLGAACYLAAAACMFAGTRCDGALAMSGFFAASTFFMHVALPNWWSVAIPQCGRHVGAVRPDERRRRVRGDGIAVLRQGLFRRTHQDLGLTAREQWDQCCWRTLPCWFAGAAVWAAYRLPAAGGRHEA